MESGRPFPPWDNRPQISFRVATAWNAFQELTTCRSMGFSVGPIPWTAIREWAAANDVPDVHRFERLVRVMDEVFLEHHLNDLNVEEA